MSLSLNVCSRGTLNISKLMSDTGLDWGVYQNCLSVWHLALESASHSEQCLPTGSLCPYLYTSCLLTQIEMALFSHFILHLFSGMPETGSLEPESLLASLTTAKQGCAVLREDGEGMGTALP